MKRTHSEVDAWMEHLNYKNIRVWGFVVRSVLTGEIAFKRDDDLRFQSKGALSPPAYRALTEDEVNKSDALTSAFKIVSQIIGKDASRLDTRRGPGRREYWRALLEATTTHRAWATFGQTENDIRWEPVEFLDYDWRTLSRLGTLGEAGRDFLNLVRRLVLAMFGLFGLVTVFVIGSIVWGLILWFLVGVFRAGVTREWSRLFDAYSIAALFLPSVPFGVVLIVYVCREWPLMKTETWVTALNRRRLDDGKGSNRALRLRRWRQARREE